MGSDDDDDNDGDGRGGDGRGGDGGFQISFLFFRSSLGSYIF